MQLSNVEMILFQNHTEIVWFMLFKNEPRTILANYSETGKHELKFTKLSWIS